LREKGGEAGRRRSAQHQRVTATPDDDTGRRRALAAIVLILALVLGILFLAHKLRDMGAIQDCVMAGRWNCAPLGR
jgi:hypothetical protein